LVGIILVKQAKRCKLSETHTLNEKRNATVVYVIRIRGRLGEEWSDWFEGLTITPEANDETLLSGPVVDQAALHGLLKKVRDLGLPLISVSRVESRDPGTPKERR
jgi:hypothetical protein